MSLLSTIASPADVRALRPAQLPQLASEIRAFLVENVAATGGHLGPNLGVVELTIALHRVFDYPKNLMLFDTGHQTYVHKLLTGRRDFTHLRERGGLSGYGARAESEQDVIENSHATTALSWADGIARGFQLEGRDGLVVAVIGDGALTGGMAWEALNNIAEDPNRPIVIVVNDNGRSYARTVGGIVRRIAPVRTLDKLRVDRRYEEFLHWGKRQLQKAGTPGQMAYDAIRGFRRGVKEILFDAGIFDSLGLKYIGPVDGHDIAQLEEAFNMAKRFGGPVVVHAVTIKGKGYKPAEDNKDDHFHAVGKIHPETGLPLVPSRFGWTCVFADEICKLAAADPKLVGIAAAMMMPVGLGPMQEAYPERVIDVGIAEQHAVTMAAGLSYAGFRPVVALYSTFMNRAFDQLLMDVALHRENVTIALDRAGVTGEDGASHNGMWDLAIAADIPGLQVAIPRDGEKLRELLRQAVIKDGPAIIRYPKGSLPTPLPAIEAGESYDVLYRNGSEEQKPLLLWGMGPLAATMLAAARECGDVPTIVIDVPWALPIPSAVTELAKTCAGVITLEDGVVDGGVGAQLAQSLRESGSEVTVRNFGIHKEFLATASRSEILAAQGMDTAAVTAAIRELAALAQSATGEHPTA